MRGGNLPPAAAQRLTTDPCRDAPNGPAQAKSAPNGTGAPGPAAGVVRPGRHKPVLDPGTRRRTHHGDHAGQVFGYRGSECPGERPAGEPPTPKDARPWKQDLRLRDGGLAVAAHHGWDAAAGAHETAYERFMAMAGR